MLSMEFCPHCGKKTLEYPYNRHWICSECGFNLYNNVAAAVGLIFYVDGCVLFEKRAKNPRKGFLALPGGFVDPDESAEQACFRECREEIGIEPVSVKYIGSFPNTYEYADIVYKTCDVFFVAKLDLQTDELCLQAKNGDKKNILLKALKAQQSEVAGFELLPVATSADIANLPLAFPTAAMALKKFIH